MPPPSPPIRIADHPPTSADVPEGWVARDGFALPAAPWDLSARRWMCLGIVRGSDDVLAALTAVVRGCGLMVAVRLEGSTHHRFLEDLQRATEHRPMDFELNPSLGALLDALADGASVTTAAQMVHVSRRTAYRMLDDVRRALGVATTAEAVSRWASQRRDP